MALSIPLAILLKSLRSICERGMSVKAFAFTLIPPEPSRMIALASADSTGFRVESAKQEAKYARGMKVFNPAHSIDATKLFTMHLSLNGSEYENILALIRSCQLPFISRSSVVPSNAAPSVCITAACTSHCERTA